MTSELLIAMFAQHGLALLPIYAKRRGLDLTSSTKNYNLSGHPYMPAMSQIEAVAFIRGVEFQKKRQPGV